MLCRLRSFPDFVEPCLPSPRDRPPAGPDWIHEIKHNGFRLLARRGAERVRLFTHNGHDWTERFPLIVEAVLALRPASCLIDGESSAMRAVSPISDAYAIASTMTMRRSAPLT
jgi:ATP-dependent DNA ligase